MGNTATSSNSWTVATHEFGVSLQYLNGLLLWLEAAASTLNWSVRHLSILILILSLIFIHIYPHVHGHPHAIMLFLVLVLSLLFP